ncbi:MAG: hypothetical protein JZU67_03540, partial [Burkholderiaceae bacterium]|nr:hypothetical protein [Burkholderiaceae bacterium]
ELIIHFEVHMIQTKFDYWSKHLHEMTRSGASLAEYAASQGLSKSCLIYWRKKTRDLRKKEPKFVSVTVARPSLTRGHLDLSKLSRDSLYSIIKTLALPDGQQE